MSCGLHKDTRILIVGHPGVQEYAFEQYFHGQKFSAVTVASRIALDTVIQASVYDFFVKHQPEYVFLSSILSGGIEANRQRPADFMYRNLESQNNILYAAHKFGVKKLCYVASSCVYPKSCSQPISEKDLLTGPLEETSESYSLAKIAGIKLCQAYRRQYGLKTIVTIPATVYGPGSDTDAQTAHVMGALIQKFLRAKQEGAKKLEVWGSGEPRREFLYSDDFVAASIFLMDHYDDECFLNMGSGEDISIKDLALLIAQQVGFNGEIVFDVTRPDGVKQKFLNNQRLRELGWSPSVGLREGIARTCQWVQANGFFNQ